MQNNVDGTSPVATGRTAAPTAHEAAPASGQPASPAYRERLTPPLWVLAAAAVVAPMAALSFTPINATIALAAGLVVGVVVIVALIALSPRVEVADGELRAGRAHIDVALLGQPVVLTGDEARAARTHGLDGRGWHLLRGGIEPVLVVPVDDPADPVRTWTISTRTPDRLAAAIIRAQLTPRTRGR